MAIRGRTYVNYPLVRPYNLTLFFDHFGQAQITAIGAITGTGSAVRSGTATISATATITGTGADEDVDVRIGRPYAIEFGPPF